MTFAGSARSDRAQEVEATARLAAIVESILIPAELLRRVHEILDDG